MQYTEIFKVVKNENFQKKMFAIFLIFAPKHRLWVHVRTACPAQGGSNKFHNLCFEQK